MSITSLYLFHLLAILHAASCLRLLFLRIPESWPSGFDVELICEFDLEGDILYAIKWFHNDQEFYRFCPTEEPNTIFFPSRGIKVDMRRTTKTSVVLRDLERITTGYFRCEVLADAPRFQTVTAEAFMTVADYYNGAQKLVYCPILFFIVLIFKLHCVRAE